MADRITFAVSVTPVETLTTENSTSVDVIASEVNVTLGGGGDSVDLDGYEDAASTQGYSNAAPYYIDAIHTAGGTQCVSGVKDFIFIKNTGYYYSSSTVLGSPSSHAVLVVIKAEAYADGTESGWVSDTTDAGEVHFFEVAYLKPGQAIVLPLGAGATSITQFGSNANDLSQLGTTSQNGVSRIYVKTVALPGGAVPSDGNAVEFLAVD
jgi:hypothetical protein